jgi:hypothetical protein
MGTAAFSTWARTIAGLALTLGLLVASVAALPVAPAARTAAMAPAGLLQATGTFTTYPTGTATLTPTAGLTVTATATGTAPVSATSTVTLVPTATATPRPTQPPRPAFLPLAVREPACTPIERHSDVVFVIDRSNYMESNLRQGVLASEWARRWVTDLVGRMDLTRSRAAVVRFNREAWVNQDLTNDRSRILAALDVELPRHSDTARMDLGLRMAGDILRGPRVTPGNGRVLIFISELQAKNVPFEAIPACAQARRGEECAVLAAADAIKAQGISLFLWATSDANDGGRILYASLASDPGKRYLLPTEADIANTHAEIESVIPCPASQFWPYPRSR